MSKQKHKQLSGGGILSLVGLLVAVSFGVTTAQSGDPSVDCASAGGTWTNNMCQMPGQQQQPTTFFCNAVNREVSSAQECDGYDQQKRTCESGGGTWNSSTASCTQPAANTTITTTCPAGQMQCPAAGTSPAGCYATCPTAGTTTTTTCPAGQMQCPAAGTSPAGCYATCPTAGTGTTNTCPAGQMQCPAAGTSPAGCYATCPTAGTDTTNTQTQTGTMQCPNNAAPTCPGQNGQMVCAMPDGRCPDTNNWQQNTDQWNTQQQGDMMRGAAEGGSFCDPMKQYFCPQTNSCVAHGTPCGGGGPSNCPNVSAWVFDFGFNGCRASFDGCEAQNGLRENWAYNSEQECLDSSKTRTGFGMGNEPMDFNFQDFQQQGFGPREMRMCAPGEMPSPRNPCKPSDDGFQFSRTFDPRAAFQNFGDMEGGPDFSDFDPSKGFKNDAFKNMGINMDVGKNGNFKFGADHDFTQAFDFCAINPNDFGCQFRGEDFDFGMMQDQYAFNPEEFMDFGRPMMSMKEIKRQTKDIAQQVKDAEREFARVMRRGLSPSLPQVAEVQTILGNAKTYLAELQAAEDEETGQALLDYFWGTPGEDGPVGGLFPRLWGGPDGDGLMPQLHRLEGLSNYTDEIARFKKDLEQRMRHAGDASEDVQAALEAAYEELLALEADPYANVDISDPFFDPRDLFESLEDLRFEIEDLFFEIDSQVVAGNLCEDMENMVFEIESFVEGGEFPDDMPEDVIEKAKVVAPEALRIAKKGLAFCEDGDLENARRAMDKLDEIGRKIGMDGGPDRRGGSEFGANAFGLDLEGVVADQLAAFLEDGSEIDIDALVAEITAKIMPKIEEAVTLAVKAAFNEMSASLVDMGVEMSDETAQVFDTVAVLDEEKQDELLEDKNELATAFKEVSEVLPEKYEDTLEGFTNDALSVNWSSEAVVDVKEEIGALENFLASEPTDAEMKEEFKAFEEFMSEKASGDVESQIEEFKVGATDAPADQWFGGIAIKGREMGIWLGSEKPNAEGDVVLQQQPGKDVNFVELGALAARTCGIKPVDHDPVVALPNMPDWAKGTIAALQDAGVSTFLDPRTNANGTATRADAFEIMVEVCGDQLPPAPADPTAVLDNFKDFNAGTVSSDVAQATAILVDGEIIRGKSDGTELALDEPLKKSEVVQMSFQILEATEDKELFQE